MITKREIKEIINEKGMREQKGVSDKIFEKTDEIAEQILSRAILITEHAGRKVVTIKDIELVIENLDFL